MSANFLNHKHSRHRYKIFLSGNSSKTRHNFFT